MALENDAAQVEADKCAVIAKDVSELAARCEADLAAAEPLVAQAEAALDTLNKKDLGEPSEFFEHPITDSAECSAGIQQVRLILWCSGHRSLGTIALRPQSKRKRWFAVQCASLTYHCQAGRSRPPHAAVHSISHTLIVIKKTHTTYL